MGLRMGLRVARLLVAEVSPICGRRPCEEPAIGGSIASQPSDAIFASFGVEQLEYAAVETMRWVWMCPHAAWLAGMDCAWFPHGLRMA